MANIEHDAISHTTLVTTAHNGLAHSALLSVRTGAGVPSGAPTANELPLAYNTTPVTGGFYYWNGAAWVKVANIL